MALDIPRVDYSSSKSTDKGKTEGKKLKENDEALLKQLEANERSKKRREEREWQKKKLSEMNNQSII